MPHKVNQMVWDDDKIYMANARGYYVINKQNGQPVIRHEFN